MKSNTMLPKATMIASLTLSILAIASLTEVRSYRQEAKNQTALRKAAERSTQIASHIADYYYREKNPVRFETINETLKHIRTTLAVYLSSSPYTEKDLVALAMIESSFNQYAVGSKKEKGLFQITPAASKALGVYQNEFDIAVNTEMAVRTLKEKYDTYKDYKKGLIAYNGVVPTKNGWQLKYWRRFINARQTVELIYKEVDSHP